MSDVIIHSIHCRGYRGGAVGFDDSDCDCGATIKALTASLAAAEAAMKAAASLPGRLWLTGQLALAEFLSGEGGENLDYALEQYEAAKGGRNE